MSFPPALVLLSMRTLTVNTFMSLDGVMQAPGGPEEDPTGGFTQGGWAVNYFDDEMMARMAPTDYELLLGRGTYEIFAAHWPYDEGPIADHLNGTRKHVASTTLEQVEWSNSTLITGDVAEYVAALKQRGRARDPGPRQPRPHPDAARARPHRPVSASGSSPWWSGAASASSATARSPPR